MDGLRWPTVAEGRLRPQGALFDAEALVEHHVGRGEWSGYEFLHVNAKTVVNPVPAASHLPFRHTVNVYRGCSHACTYCFARPTHSYLGLGPGEDFERRIVVKVNAVERVRAEVEARRWAGHRIAMGTNTDPYQRCEGRYRLTRGVVEVLTERRNPFSILTKSTLILRDLDLLVEASRHTDVRVNLSIGTLDDDVWRTSEPGTPAPRLRVEALRRLREAGVACGVLIAPVLPGLSDGAGQLEALVEAVVDAGATSVSSVPLYLKPVVREHYLAWLAGIDPDLAATTAQRYTGSHLPRGEEAAITASVGEMVERARRRRRRRATSAPADAQWIDGDFAQRLEAQMGADGPAPGPRAGRSTPPAPETVQLGLGV